MKPLMIIVFTSIAISIAQGQSAMPVEAQASGGTSSAPERHPVHRRSAISIDERVKVLAKNLDLNEAQQAAVKKILEQRQQETMRIRLDSSLSPEARIGLFRALQDSTVQRIRGVLNEEQKKKYDPLAVRRIQPPDQKTVEDYLKATTPH